MPSAKNIKLVVHVFGAKVGVGVGVFSGYIGKLIFNEPEPGGRACYERKETGFALVKNRKMQVIHVYIENRVRFVQVVWGYDARDFALCSGKSAVLVGVLSALSDRQTNALLYQTSISPDGIVFTPYPTFQLPRRYLLSHRVNPQKTATGRKSEVERKSQGSNGEILERNIFRN
ncbi:hypothetical protein RUM44_008001 [Polyplax serrata]|uniref:Uncharacterized protein n=1 Tax=Polyplax serrata TaxID=468196 RepID=A0ABR1BB10_POLSC